MEINQGVVARESFEFIRSSLELNSCFPRNLVGHRLGKADVSVESSAHGRSSLGQVGQLRERLLDSFDRVLHLLSVAAEFLSQGQGRRVLGVGPADLNDLLKLLRLLF